MSALTRIASTFSELKSQGRMAFMPFVTAGDPDMPTTLRLIRELAARGVHLIEVGFPYSDPIADGPVIQASYTRALDKGLRTADIFAGISSLAGEGVARGGEGEGEKRRQEESPAQPVTPSPHPPVAPSPDEPLSPIPPLVAMVSYSLVFRNGPETFVGRAAEAGFSGLIVPDLPGDEAGELAAVVKSHGLDLVQLVAPTTPPDRAERILKSAGGFVYCISVSGTTGVRDQLPPELQDQLRWLRTKTDLPLAVGFGISRPDQVDMLRGLAEGVIVGSAIVRRTESLSNGSGSPDDILTEIGNFAAEMVVATSG